MVRHCAGGVILGFGQLEASSGLAKRGTSAERTIEDVLLLPSAWNHLEAGIIYAAGLPVLVFREDGVQGGIFDPGVTDAFIHKMPKPRLDESERQDLRDLLLRWQTDVRRRYYGEYRNPPDSG